MLSTLDKYDSVNERNQEITESIKLRILGVWLNAHKFIRQLANARQDASCGGAWSKRSDGLLVTCMNGSVSFQVTLISGCISTHLTAIRSFAGV